MTAASPGVSTADLQAMGSPAALPYTGREQLVLCPGSLGSASPLLPLPWTRLDILENIYFATPE